MTPYSPSSIGTVQRHCPRALDFYHERAHVEANRPMQVGRAAHLAHAYAWEWRGDASLDGAWEAFAARALARMCSLPDDPIPPDYAVEGIGIMRAFLEANPFSPESKVECGYAFDRDWNVLDKWDDPKARFRVVLDLLDECQVGGDDSDAEEADPGLAFALIRDFKTGWGANDEMLRSLQMCAYAVAVACLIKQVPGMDRLAGIRREIVAVRKGSGGAGVVYADDLLLDDEGWAQIEEWKRLVTATMAALDTMKEHGDGGMRPAVVGAGCMGCPYQRRCDAFREVWTQEVFGRRDMEPETDADRVKLLAVCEAAIDRVKPQIALACSEGEDIRLPDGRVFGYCEDEKRQSAEYAAAILADEWTKAGNDVAGFYAKLGGVPVSTSEKFATALFPLRGVPKEGKEAVVEKREELLSRVTTIKKTQALGWIVAQPTRATPTTQENGK